MVMETPAPKAPAPPGDLTPLLRLRQQTANVLFSANPDDRLTRRVDIFLILLITLNIVAVILESVHSIQEQWTQWFITFEIFSIAVFTIEYIARVWSAVDNPWRPDHAHPVRGRLRYARTYLAIIDLLAIAPFYLSVFFAIDLRFLRVLRLIRIFKLTRYSPAMTLLLQVIREEARTIGAAMFVLMMMVVIASSLAFIVEHDAGHTNAEAFSSIPAAMYWAIITMTTVGYGDIVPITVAGKVLSAFIGIIGMGMVALPAGILASGFSNALHRRREQLEEKVSDIIADGVISEQEEAELSELMHQLNLNQGDAKALLAAAHHKQKTRVCPHCHKPLE